MGGFGSGTPTFLVDTLKSRGTLSLDLEGMRVGDRLLSAFDIDRIEPETLPLQTGHLTVSGIDRVAGNPVYRPAIPTGRCARA